MSFDAHGSVQGEATPTPSMEGGKIPEAAPAPAAPATPAPAASGGEAAPKPAQSLVNPNPAAPAAPAAPTPPWQPNFKFKVMDKEHEIAEFLRSAVKNAEHEKALKELHEKAYGLDVVKPRFKEAQEKYRELDTTHKGVLAQIQALREDYNRGDFDSFFQKLRIPEEKVLQWVLAKAQYNELPPEQRAVYDARKAAEKRALDLEKQNQELSGQLTETVSSAKGQLLQIELAKPDVSAIAQAFDSRPGGKPGDFRNEVINRGELALALSGKDLTPAEAVQEAIALLGGYARQAMPNPDPARAAPAPQPAPEVAPAQAKKPAAIPNISGKAASATGKPKPRSIEDLKKLAAGQPL